MILGEDSSHRKIKGRPDPFDLQSKLVKCKERDVAPIKSI